VLVEGVRVTDVRTLDGTDASRALELETTAGTVVTDRVVLATGTPILDRGGHFALLKPGRSYVSAFTVPGPIPKGMHVTIDEPGRSLRTARAGDRELLLVGGNGHPVGREENAKAKLDDLAQWTREHWPGAELTHSWSAQDYEPAAAVPYVGGARGQRRAHLRRHGIQQVRNGQRRGRVPRPRRAHSGGCEPVGGCA